MSVGQSPPGPAGRPRALVLYAHTERTGHGLEAGEVGRAPIFRRKFRRRHAQFPFYLARGDTQIHTLIRKHRYVCLGKKHIRRQHELDSFDARSCAPMEVSTLSAGSYSSALPRLGSCKHRSRAPWSCAAEGAGGDGSPLEWKTRGS